MSDFWQRLKQRKLVQWAVAYLAASWELLQLACSFWQTSEHDSCCQVVPDGTCSFFGSNQ